jgi:cytochrome c-type biogenesis protein CcmF
VVLVGTLWPLAAEAMGEKISVGPPYFNKATAPIGLLLMLALAVGPMLRWRNDDGARLKRLVAPAAMGLIVGAFVAVQSPAAGLFPILALALAAGLAVAAFLPLVGRKLLRTPLSTWGMAIAHFGLAVSVAGMAAESGWSSEKLAAMRPGDQTKIARWTVQLSAVRPVAGDNWVAIEGQMKVSGGGTATTLAPQARQFFEPVQQTSEAALLTRWDGQLYAVIAPVEENSFDRWQVRLWWKPFVTLIWYGGGLIALGGLLALLGRSGLLRRRRNREEQNPWGPL